LSAQTLIVAGVVRGFEKIGARVFQIAEFLTDQAAVVERPGARERTRRRIVDDSTEQLSRFFVIAFEIIGHGEIVDGVGPGCARRRSQRAQDQLGAFVPLNRVVERPLALKDQALKIRRDAFLQFVFALLCLGDDFANTGERALEVGALELHESFAESGRRRRAAGSEIARGSIRIKIELEDRDQTLSESRRRCEPREQKQTRENRAREDTAIFLRSFHRSSICHPEEKIFHSQFPMRIKGAQKYGWLYTESAPDLARMNANCASRSASTLVIPLVCSRIR